MIRQRACINSSGDNEDGNENQQEQEDKPLMIRMKSKDGAISCSEMIIDMQPVMHGPCAKRSGAAWLVVVKGIFDCCLFFLPNRALIWGRLFSHWQWRQRYLVLIGSFLYRFESTCSDDIKGMPIPVDAAHACTIGASAASEWGIPEDDRERCVLISTLRKRYVLMFSDGPTARRWVNEIHQRRQDCVKEQLGHLSLRCAAWGRCNQMGNKRFFGRLQQEHDDAQLGSDHLRNSPMHPM